ncbi:hypothetical protein ACGFK1_20035 [Mycobacterium sp. NPDC048908]|uniref:hypothetical protein n=1 Tax=Mycobacterium sp. NPDC048908 TaxID=3364292 RepID=UPI003724002A
MTAWWSKDNWSRLAHATYEVRLRTTIHPHLYCCDDDAADYEYRDPHEVADQLDETAVVCLPNAVPREWLAHARADVEDRLRTHGVRDHFIRSPQNDERSAAKVLTDSPSAASLLTDIVRTRFPDEPATLQLTGSALRIIAGPRGEGDAFWFHYDASIVTMVVPIFLPQAPPGNAGELVGLFNKRPFRRFVLTNIVDKAVGQCNFYRKQIVSKLEKLHRVDMEIGNAYLFWGYRSLHGNMPCQSGALRATLLLHFGRPHGTSEALTAAARVGQSLRSLGRKRTDEEVVVGAY